MNNIYHQQDLSERSFLVTGGAGFIGSHIAEYLLKNHAQRVCILDNLATGSQQNLAILKQYPAFEFIEGDIRNLDTCRSASKNIDYINHQAALGSVPRSVKEPFASNDVNVGGFVNMLTAAVENKVKRFVYASSSSVYGDDPSLPKKEDKIGNCISPYAVSKRANELYGDVFARVYGLPVIGFRYFNIFGPRQSPEGPYAAVIPLFVKAIITGNQPRINGDGEQTRDFTFIENAVQANIKGMLTSNANAINKVYNIAVGETFSINYIFEKISEYLKSDLQPIHAEPRPGDVRNSLADISRAKDLLDYSPGAKFDSGLIKTIEYFKKLYTARDVHE